MRVCRRRMLLLTPVVLRDSLERNQVMVVVVVVGLVAEVLLLARTNARREFLPLPLQHKAMGMARSSSGTSAVRRRVHSLDLRFLPSSFTNRNLRCRVVPETSRRTGRVQKTWGFRRRDRRLHLSTTATTITHRVTTTRLSLPAQAIQSTREGRVSAHLRRRPGNHRDRPRLS
jgi:hypothetical protein